MPVSKSQIKATTKYNKANYDKLTMCIPLGEKEKIAAYAKSRGESTTAFFLRAVRETMVRDAEKAKEE